MDDSRFDQFLAAHAAPPPEVPRDFQRGVWQRIARRATERRSFGRWLLALLTRPVPGAVLLALGVWAGVWLGSGTANRADYETYLASITPHAQAHSARP